jgi:excisionase family DNA binding protein
MEDFVLVPDAARELNVSKWAVWKLIERDQLKARKIGMQYFIPRAELERLKEARRAGKGGPGRPRKDA